MTKPNCFIFDIDGTLADNSHRQEWIKSKPKNWKAYNKDMTNDKLIMPVALVAEFIAECTMRLFICTGREETYREVTEDWLQSYDIVHDHLYMRPARDYRDDCVVKEEMLLKIQENFNVVGVFDDRRKVVDMWRKHRCFVFDVNQTRSEF